MRLPAFLALAAFAVSSFANAQPPQVDPGARPKVCLVLSGGGARGAAHVGVIKALEALRVPIDCVAGTSMGALVGGAYASGMTPSEMESVLEGDLDRAPVQGEAAAPGPGGAPEAG